MKKSLNLAKLLLIFIFLLNVATALPSMDHKSLEKIKNAVVTINTRIAMSAYDSTGNWCGTGFIVDKKSGIVITNAHVAGKAAVGQYILTFYNGHQTEAKLLYYDSWQDYAFLKLSPEELPKSATEIKFSSTKPKLDQKVFIIGNNEGKEFSFHDGYISSLYTIEGELPQGTYIINLNTAGGSSGSPVIGDNNEAIALNYGGSQTHALALSGEYIKSALKHIQNGRIPVRKHIGVISTLYSLDKAVKHQSFPKKLVKQYIESFPDARNKVIKVNSLIAGSPAEKLLKPGDIVWAVEDVQIGADLNLIDQLMDNSTKDKIKLTIYREGEKIDQEVTLYDVNSYKIDKMLEFAGAIFFQADDLFSRKTGIPLGSLSVKNIRRGSAFSVIPVYALGEYDNNFRLLIHKINRYKLSGIDDLMNLMSDITAQKFLSIQYKNYQFYAPEFNPSYDNLISAQDELQTDVELDNIDIKSRVLKFNPQKSEWEAENIN